MQAYEAILFDFDGVLLDSEPLHFACWRQVLATLGIDLDWECYRDHCIGVADREMVAFMAALAPMPVTFEQLWELYPLKSRLYVERVADNPPFPEGTRRLLPALSRSYKLAVVSSSGRKEVEPLLEAGGLRPYFATIVAGEDVERHKPAPEPYLTAARRLGVSRALVVEDSEPGVASGLAAGFDVLRIECADRLSEALADYLNRGSQAGR